MRPRATRTKDVLSDAAIVTRYDTGACAGHAALPSGGSCLGQVQVGQCAPVVTSCPERFSVTWVAWRWLESDCRSSDPSGATRSRIARSTGAREPGSDSASASARANVAVASLSRPFSPRVPPRTRIAARSALRKAVCSRTHPPPPPPFPGLKRCSTGGAVPEMGETLTATTGSESGIGGSIARR